MAKKPYYITTAIAYTSGKPHIGNTYEVVLADSIARYKRFVGYDVRFQTGTDEHGQKIEIKAFENLSTQKEFVDDVARRERTSMDRKFKSRRLKTYQLQRNLWMMWQDR